jgi:cell division protein FtsQ
MAAIMLYGLLASNEYTVRRLAIDGLVVGDAQEVAATADVMDESIFLVQPESVAARLLTLPYVAGVEVEADLPGAVTVTIIEQEPALVVHAAGASYVVDDYGMVLGPAQDSALPAVSFGQELLAPGNQLDAELVTAILAVGSAVGEDGTLLAWDAVQGITVRLADKREIIFGGPQRIPEKLAVLEAILTQLEADWSMLDLTEPDRPYSV